MTCILINITSLCSKSIMDWLLVGVFFNACQPWRNIDLGLFANSLEQACVVRED